MTIHGHTLAVARGAVAVLSAVLLATATATALPHGLHAATVCGGTANDIVGKFVDNHSGAAGTPGQGYQGVATVTFSVPTQ